MATLEARIETERPSRYLARLCTHAASMGRGPGHRPRVHLGGPLERRDVRVRADCTDTQGTVTFDPWGRCSMVAGANVLTVRIDATDEESLRRIQAIVTDDLSRFSGRDALFLEWRRPPEPGIASGEGPTT